MLLFYSHGVPHVSQELSLPDHVWRLPNPVSHSKARRWATVSIRCPLCKSQPRYIILWFICTSGWRIEWGRDEPPTSFCYSVVFDEQNARWARHSPMRRGRRARRNKKKNKLIWDNLSVRKRPYRFFFFLLFPICARAGIRNAWRVWECGLRTHSPAIGCS